MRFSKVKITNYRPMTGLDRLADIQVKEKNEHDRALADYPRGTLQAIAEDLCARKAWNTKDPEQRWIMSRRAAALRRLSSII